MDAAAYPVPNWEPTGGFSVDRALIYGLIRQESGFRSHVRSRSGASGVMQLMPTTASYVSGRRQFKNREGQRKLMDPETNLEIGQRYLENLLKNRNVNGDLFSLLIAYNAGPGNLSRRKRAMPHIEDPLLFVESIPLAETRAYVERVLSNYWIDRLREDLPTPTLDAVAQGKWAQYAAVNVPGQFKLADSR